MICFLYFVSRNIPKTWDFTKFSDFFSEKQNYELDHVAGYID